MSTVLFYYTYKPHLPEMVM